MARLQPAAGALRCLASVMTVQAGYIVNELERVLSDIGPTRTVFLAKREGEVVGAAVREERRRACWDIRLLFVHPRFARRGIGGALIDALLAGLATGTRVNVVLCECVRSAGTLYICRGFCQSLAASDEQALLSIVL